MDSSDSLKLDENLARFLAAYDQEIDGGDPKAATVNVPLPPEERARATADITGMLERGALVHNVAQAFDLPDIVAAHEAVEAGKAMGNIVVRIA